MTGRFDIAIIGASCRLPGARNLEEFADLLFAGRDAVREMPGDRFTKSRFYFPEAGQPGKTYSFAAGFIDQVDGFDAGFFGVSPREAVSIDPQQRIMLELAFDAVCDAGLTLGGLAGSRTGVYIGGSSWDFAAKSFADAAALDAYSMQGAALSSLSNRVSYLFDLRGPSFTVDTACSSSLVALHLACSALRRGETEMALVGGINLLVAPQAFVGFARASMLSRIGKCHPFDARADGYVRAEGGGAVLLKPLDHALLDGDDIRAVIRATGVNSDGRTNGFSMPSRAAQAALLREIYEQNAIDPNDLVYFEAHGTGTPVGDPIEAHAIGEALAQRRRNALPIGSVKSNIGHLEPASGMAGLLKLILAFEHGCVPRSLNFVRPNPHIPFAALNLQVVGAPLALPASGEGGGDWLAGLNSFGFGGTNAHAVIAAPPRPVRREQAALLPPLLISARSEESLVALVATWRDRLLDAPLRLPALIRGAATKRDQFPHRVMVEAASAPEMAQELDLHLAGERPSGVAAGHAVHGDLVLVYSGNGSQWAGMGRDALAHSPAFRAAMAQLDHLLTPLLGWSVIDRLASDDLAEALHNTDVAQPLLFSVQVAIVSALRARGIKPAAHIGHSVGEVAAAWACGALSLADACLVIVARSRAQQMVHGTGSMAALGLDESEAAAVIAAHRLDLVVAAINASASVTVAGSDESIEALRLLARAQKWVFVRLDLAYAFHSPCMEPIRLPLMARLEAVASHVPAEAMISTVTGESVVVGELDALYWWRNVREPVRFRDAVAALIERGARIFVEIGSAPVLQSFLRDGFDRSGCAGKVMASLSRRAATRDPFALIAAQLFVAGADLGGAACFAGEATARGLPLYPWQRQDYVAAPTIERVELASPVRDHPLLGFRDPTYDRGAELAWMSHLSVLTEPWLADHCLDGVPLLPAAAMIDMMLAAARIRHPAATSLEIQDLEISRGLILDPGVVRDCRVKLAEDGEIAIASRPRLAHEDLTVHATGRVMPGFSALPVLAGADADESHDQAPIEADRVYQLARGLKLDYGPEFQTVQSVQRIGPDRLRARLRAPRGNRGGEGYLLDPALLDGALQALVVFAADQPQLAALGSVLPWRFGRIRLLRTDAGVPSMVDLAIRHVGPRSLCADFTLRDEDNQTLVELVECWFVAMPTGRSARQIDRLFTHYLPSLRQVPRPAPPAAAVEASVPWPASALLADAYLAAATHEAFNAEPALQHTELGAQALRWLAEEQYAELRPDGARLVPETDLPPADVIWRSLFFDAPEAVAETTLLASFRVALATGQWPGFSGVLRRQFLFASSSAQAALQALSARIAATTDVVRRIAVAGLCSSRMLRAILAGNPQAVVWALAADAESLAEWQELLREEPRLQPRLISENIAALAGSFDLVAGFYALSLGQDPQMLAALLAPGGQIVLTEPADARAARLLFGAVAPDARLHAPADWAATLEAAGLAAASARIVGGVIWPVALIEARQSGTVAAPAPLPAVGLFAAPDDPIALAWAVRDASLAVRAPAFFGAAVAHFGEATEVMVILPQPPEIDAASLGTGLSEYGKAISSIEEGGLRRLWLVVRGRVRGDLFTAALAGWRRVIANELPWLDLRLVVLDPALPPAEQLDALARECHAPDAERESFWGRAGRAVPRLRVQPPRRPKTAAPRRLEVLQPGLIGSLAWVETPPRAPVAGEVAIEVRAVSLNFRDVMWAQGLLPDEALLEGFSGASLGLECAGVVSAVGEGVDDLAPGDKVIAVTPAALATHAVTRRTGVIRLPAGMDFAAAATIPVAFMTAAYALGHLAQLAQGETVLIHGGAGGVGLAAIQYALDRGAVVYATAGSEMRRQMLLRLGVAEVFDSRSASFADNVWAATRGRGVDVVLNSLSDELMLQSVRLLAPFGRFLEIGKRDLYRNTRVGIRSLRHNASYFAIDSDELVAHRPQIGIAVLREIEAMLQSGRLRPLPYRAYGFGEVVDAFRLLQSSGHVGKVVLLPEPTEVRAEASLKADAGGVFVVTGGLSGFGLATARWLESKGATGIALLSRKGPETPDYREIIAGFTAQARAFACDVADREALGAVLARIRSEMGPIKGVLHAAMVLDDANVADLTEERFARVVGPKLDGALALDQLTAGDDLQLFVLFSSVTTVIGTPGQANYVAANAAMEALAERRVAAGKPALAVQWGPIADAGYLTRETRIGEMLEKVLGAAPLASADALAALPSLLASGHAVVGVSDAAWGDLRQRLPGLAGPFWADTPQGRSRNGSGPTLSAQIVGLSDEEALPLVLDMLVEEVGAILKLEAKAIDINRPVQEFGVDSLMAVELRTALEMRLGVALPLLALSDATSLRAMALKLLQALRGGGSADDLAHAMARHEGETAANVAAE